jgi:hypothetical protein
MLNEPQTATLRAAVDRLIPPDESPGGVEAGAADYILGQLSRDLAPLRETYLSFLDALDADARDRYAGTAFAALSPESQDAILRRFESDPAHAPFFRRFVEHAQEGFYTSPEAWGMIGWKVKG